MDWLLLAEFSIVGLLSGGVLALIALGFVLVYKGTRVINFAMGEFRWSARICSGPPTCS
jgi:branched-chain amino acid transport system permease protein